jgi:hypothetical protein
MSSHVSDTHIYLDLQIVNNNQNNNEPPPVLRFEETRNSPVLPGDRADYFCSILRFSVETGDEIPVFIPRIELGESQMDVNKTVYRVTVEHNGVSKTVPLIWDPIDLSVEPPQPPMLKQNIMSRYYYMTNFSQFLPMINNALKEAWSIVGSEKNNSPFLDFDPETSKFNINSDVEYITKGASLILRATGQSHENGSNGLKYFVYGNRRQPEATGITRRQPPRFPLNWFVETPGSPPLPTSEAKPWAILTCLLGDWPDGQYPRCAASPRVREKQCNYALGSQAGSGPLTPERYNGAFSEIGLKLIDGMNAGGRATKPLRPPANEPFTDNK